MLADLLTDFDEMKLVGARSARIMLVPGDTVWGVRMWGY